MISLQKSLGTLATGKRKTTWGAFWSVIVSLRRRYSNRRDLRTLHEFNDHQLADIGLTRDDLRYALRDGPLDDHSLDLNRAVLRRRSRLDML